MSKDLCIQEANRQKCPVDIALATVEAETGFRNITGDNGNAISYGQIWKKWHWDAFEYAANLLNVPVPPNDLPSLTAYTLSNNPYGMAVSIRVIHQDWSAVKGDFRQFSLKYVGPAIPDSDYQRRLAIWNKYHNSNFDYTSTTSFLNTDDTSNTSTSITIPSTNYEVVNESTTNKGLLYGRRYRIIVSLAGENALDVSDLRCTFKCVKTALAEPNYSEVVLYNLSAQTENAIIQEGSRIIIEAGYEGDQYGIIFDGNVLQPIREKENGNTYKLTLICIDGDVFYNGAFLVTSLVRGQTARDIVNTCTSKGSVTAQNNFISDSLSKSKLTRGKVLFGQAKTYLKQVAKSENATFYLDDGKVNLIKASDFNKNEIVELNPTSGLIGVPTQQNYGVTGKCLLNPRIKLNSLIHIDNSLVRAQQASQTAQYTLDNDGIYRVTKITYTGDTRGANWYTEFQTVSQAGNIPSMLTNSSLSMW